MAESVNRNINEAYRTFDLNFVRAFLSGAQGRYLDLIGELLGLTRAGIATASADSSSETVQFSTETNVTFGDINNNNSIVIPSGTIISTGESVTGITYRTTVPTVLSASARSAFVSVESTTPGSTSNVGIGVLNFHNFTNYTDVDNDSLKVTNISDITTGEESESDANYRFRLANQTLAAEAANSTAVRVNTLLVPGVADLLLVPFYKGIGTFRVFIKSITPTVSASLLQAVNAELELLKAQGVIAEAAKPKESGLELKLTLRYRNKIPDEERDAIEASVQDALRDYINGLDLGEEFVVNEAVQRVLDVSDSIKDIGKANQPFDNIYIYKETELEDNKVRSELFGNYVPGTFERVIVEQSISAPITILRAN